MSASETEVRPEESIRGTERTIYLQEPMPHQRPFYLDPSRFKVNICGRRYGKSVVARAAATAGHGLNGELKGCLDGGQIWWVMPSFPLARETFDFFAEALSEVWVRRNATERFFILPGGGSLWFKSSDDPNSCRGSGIDGLIIDELKDHPIDVWKSALRPTLMDKRGWLIACGTPSLPDKDNLAYHLFRQAENRPGWHRWQEPTSRNPIVTAEEIAESREEMGPYRAARELDAQFVAPGGGLFKTEHLAHTYRLEDGWIVLDNGERYELARLRRFGTADLAASTKTYSDFTVIGSWAELPTTASHPKTRLVLLDVFRDKIDGAAIITAFKEARAKHNLSKIYVEGTAYHNLLIDEAIAQGIPLERVDSHKDKVTRAEPAAVAATTGRLLLPKSARWLDDFRTELLCFPGEKGHPVKDDQVDVVSSAFAVLAEDSSAGPWLGAPRQPGFRRRF